MAKKKSSPKKKPTTKKTCDKKCSKKNCDIKKVCGENLSTDSGFEIKPLTKADYFFGMIKKAFGYE
jgi:hypothetical protein